MGKLPTNPVELVLRVNQNNVHSELFTPRVEFFIIFSAAALWLLLVGFLCFFVKGKYWSEYVGTAVWQVYMCGIYHTKKYAQVHKGTFGLESWKWPLNLRTKGP